MNGNTNNLSNSPLSVLITVNVISSNPISITFSQVRVVKGNQLVRCRENYLNLIIVRVLFDLITQHNVSIRRVWKTIQAYRLQGLTLFTSTTLKRPSTAIFSPPDYPKLLSVCSFLSHPDNNIVTYRNGQKNRFLAGFLANV